MTLNLFYFLALTFLFAPFALIAEIGFFSQGKYELAALAFGSYVIPAGIFAWRICREQDEE